MTDDIYYSKRRLQRVLSQTKSDNHISEKNKEHIMKFYEFCFAQGLSDSRVVRILYSMIAAAKLLEKDFAEVDKGDAISMMGKLEASSYADRTKQEFKITIKKFYKWLRNSEVFPPEVKWIKVENIGNRKLPEDLLTEDDVKNLINAAKNPRDRALVSILFETGIRVGELLSLRLKNVAFDDYGTVLVVNGKTGMRRVRAIASTPYLQSWLNQHPKKSGSESALWIGYKDLSYNGVCVILKRLKRISGITKKVNPHNFRHSRATNLAACLPEAIMKEHFGWAKDSKMAATYVHLSGQAVDKAILSKVYGVEVNGDRKQAEFRPKECMRCKLTNAPTDSFCNRCGMALDKETIVKIIESENKQKYFGDALDKMLDDKEFLCMFMEKASKLLKTKT